MIRYIIFWLIGAGCLVGAIYRLSQGNDTEAILLTMFGLYHFQLNTTLSISSYMRKRGED